MEGVHRVPIAESQFCRNGDLKSDPTQCYLGLKQTREMLNITVREDGKYGDQEKSSLFLEQGIPIEKFVRLLNTYTKEKSSARALSLHAHVVYMGLEGSSVIGNLLITMLVETGLVQDAQRVFDSTEFRDQCSWDNLISAYVDGGDFLKALDLYDLMKYFDPVHLSAYTFMALIKACTQLKDLERGQALHSQIASNGWLKFDAFYVSSLVHMYFKCGLPAKAQGVFDELQVRDTVVWNAMITGYAEHGHGEEALICFERMQLERVVPSDVSFIGSLQGCGCIKATERGQELHSEIVKKGLLDRGLGIGSSLVDMYAKCGLRVEARQVFDRLKVRDTASWSSLMAGYIDYGCASEALDCFKQMQLEGVSMDAFALVCSLKACGCFWASEKGQKLHSQILKKGIEMDNSLGSSLVDMYSSCGLFERAYEVFNSLSIRDTSAWNALLAGYVEQGHGEDALKCFDQMQVEGITPDLVTFAYCLKACGSVNDIERGVEIHEMLKRDGLEGERFVRNSLVDMYGKCGMVAKSQEVFNNLVARDVISWNTLISGYVEHGYAEEALNCVKLMQSDRISPDATTSVCSLKACGIIGARDKGQEMHAEVVKKGFEDNPLVKGTLVYMYAKCGLLAEAQTIFDELPVREKVSWNALLNGYAQLGDSESVFGTFEKMIESGEQPDLVSFLGVLHACCHAGLLDQALVYFSVMTNDYGIIPALEHHTCLIDLHGRAGQLSKALELIERMPYHADVALWFNLLGACQKWGEVKVGTRAFEHCVQLDKENGTAYVQMCNIYTNAGMHEDAKRIDLLRERMQKTE
ncbi:hypothetical protein GOP47_0018217 [Adiantum capillus-veneris]|uniref:Pentatricopeptide repeat-containing protein n=1 Tax=Adiantum capillus-veneris TaxID=13818 RepID=A0A9D4ZAE7_ADICA|nr:hypothetical protein GOP47_0018217 [Adiantum capillus-veneris]